MGQSLLVKLFCFTTSIVCFGCFTSWPTAVAIIATIFIHENGRMFAAHKIGLYTEPVCSVPFLGGLAIFNGYTFHEKDKIRVAESGLFCSFACMLLFLFSFALTGETYFAGMTKALVVVNAIFLLPIGALDGGKFLRALAFSVHKYWGNLAMVAGVVLAALLIRVNILFLALLTWSLTEFSYEVTHPVDRRKMDFLEWLQGLGVYAGFVAVLVWVYEQVGGYEGNGALDPFLFN